MRCPIVVLSPQRILFQVTNTHVDLRGNTVEGGLGGVTDGEKSAEDKLYDKIEHAALDGYDDCSPTGPCREGCAHHIASFAWGEVPDASNNEGSHHRVPA